MKGKHVGSTQIVNDPLRVLMLAVIKEALEDLTRKPSACYAIDPHGARAWLLSSAPDLLRLMGLDAYAARLPRLVVGVPQPGTYQMPLGLL